MKKQVFETYEHNFFLKYTSLYKKPFVPPTLKIE